MALPKKREIADADYDKARARQHRKFLHNVVLPHLEGMAIPEDGDDENLPANCAILNLNEYTKGGLNPSEVSSKYNCGREGCFAGWYTFISDKYKRLSIAEQSQLEDYDEDNLAGHFGITQDDASDIFSPYGGGVENKLAEFDTRVALVARGKKLKSIMRRKRDFA